MCANAHYSANIITWVKFPTQGWFQNRILLCLLGLLFLYFWACVCLWSKTNWESNLWYLPIWSDLMCQQWKLSWLFQWYFIGNNPRSINYYALAKKSTPIVNEKFMSQIYFFELWVFWNPWPQISSLEEKEIIAMKYQNVSESIDQTDETESLLSIF